MIKLINAQYYPEDGFSEATIATEIGNFYGYSYLHPDDEQVASSFLGCEIAEYRATIAYFKELLKRLNIEIKTLYDIEYSTRPIVPMIVKKKIKQKEDFKKEILYNIKSLKDIIDNKVENRLLIIEKLAKYKEQKDKQEEIKEGE